MIPILVVNTSLDLQYKIGFNVCFIFYSTRFCLKINNSVGKFSDEEDTELNVICRHISVCFNVV